MIATTAIFTIAVLAVLMIATIAGGIMTEKASAKGHNVLATTDKEARQILKDMGGTGPITSFDMHKQNGNWVDDSKVNSASASKADSASAARSENNVKCFAFCLGISNAKSASSADSESRTNSPGNTATAAPITQSDPTPPAPKVFYTPPVQQIIPPTPQVKTTVSAGTQCIDNTGSIQDEGYMYGYYDAQGKIGGIDEHGKHTGIWKQGYNRGFADGFNDEAMGVYRNPC